MADENLNDFLGVKETPGWRRYAKWGGMGVVLLVLIALLARCFASPEDPGFATVEVTRDHLVTTVSATGKLAPTNQVTVGSQISGLVVTVSVDVNDRVEKGQVLAQIDTEQLDGQIRQNEAQVNANRASVGQAQATVAEAQAQLARLEEVYRLSDGRVPSRTELQAGRANAQRAIATLRSAQASVAASQAALSQTKVQRARAQILSPVSGVVLARQVDPGQTVAASFNTPTLFVIAEDLTRMKLEVAIDEADVGSVKDGQAASFTVDAFPGKTFPARITRVDVGSNLSVSAASSSSSTTTTSSTTGQVVSYAADLSVDNKALDLRPGMTATADIVTSDKKNVLLVPNAALRFTPQSGAGAAAGGGITSALSFGPPRRGGGSKRSVTMERGAQQTVYVLGEDGKPAPVKIVTGDSDGSQTEVVSGDLKPGMKVITGQLAAAGTAGGKPGAGSGAGSGGGGQRRSGGN
ncbi:efflux RND transporter periplasmic adaptor subunit [Sphingobium sufflavum]|uniref:efflux RND transporter periplasmic adaptor subunit n=1 Tax=Sphingobium sufflavum TaxID=1129547 RepID=UPI001F322C2B|nr:efflux RND transporter periplasmic adaptor subunit [Sphingobium sufflavum]MCE7795479.1 efflux RND transporter periplasmic adaptor subunit [Sphingobium sufflavum]